MSIVTHCQKRISGPLLDRIDIHSEAPRVDYEKLSGDRLGEPSAAICRPQFGSARGLIELTDDLAPMQDLGEHTP